MVKRPFISFVFIGLAIFSLAACGSNTGNVPNSTPTGSVSGSPTATTPTSVPFKVTSVELVVNPDSIAGKTCGSSASFTYTVTFHMPANSAGGTIQFEYTLNNGRSSTNASVAVGPGDITKTYTFSSSGTLYADHTYPGLGGVITSSPNTLQSPMVQPTGMCSQCRIRRHIRE